MNGWDIYESRMVTNRQAWLDHAQMTIHRKLMSSLACQEVTIDGESRVVAIIGRTQLDEKRICSLPGEKLPHGGLVEFAGCHWLITEIDVADEVYQRGIMQRCNHSLRWIGKDGVLREKWCIVEDGTKYLIGEKVVSLMTVGDSRIAITVGKDDDTIELGRGHRFLIDDELVEEPSVYQITKANRFFNTTDCGGVFRFILTEVALTHADNVEKRIADYTAWTPDRQLDSDHVDSDKTIVEIVQEATNAAQLPKDDNKKGWL